MTIVLSLPELTDYFTKNSSVGSVVAGCLIIVFLIAALSFGLYQMRHMKKQMNRLDEETRARRATELSLEEELCAVGARRPAAKQMSNPWQS
jgi:uncharacterized membrane protein YidH (DUF202 family)